MGNAATKLETLEWQLKLLQDRAQEYKDKLYAVKNDIYEKRGEIFTEKFNIKAGDKVSVTNSRGTKIYIFCRIDKGTMFDAEKTWIYGRLVKKDGTASKKETLLYNDWEIVKE